MLKGDLPWARYNNRMEGYKEKVLRKKEEFGVTKLCKGTPTQVAQIGYHLKTVIWQEPPDYDLVVMLFFSHAIAPNIKALQSF